MDLRTGYWQIEVDEHDREKTAFITPNGLYEFRNDGYLLKGLKWNICLCSLDDIVVYGPSFKEHLKRQLKILGYVNENGIHPDPENVEAILKFQFLKNDLEGSKVWAQEPELARCSRDWCRFGPRPVLKESGRGGCIGGRRRKAGFCPLKKWHHRDNGYKLYLTIDHRFAAMHVQLSLVSRSEYTVMELFNMSCLSYSSIPSYNRPGETLNIMTFLERTTSPALHQINHLSITSPPLSHHMVECSVGPAPQAANINIGYVEASNFKPEEEDIKDYVEELKTWLAMNKVPKGDWTKALVWRLPLDGREIIKCRFEPERTTAGHVIGATNCGK
ncbi:hypothetical protein LAZ67_22000971 [Cordylochernes scorpioides]|uniref:Uncharacterized protein n=1 Tax=Cordylochernes scorpioides TaxID=51811 RepID=A0ABY6LNQ9_9ARAC|nr:hypothetical protein LAZ67_22000971 [Cordylochernes scorpioides]